VTLAVSVEPDCVGLNGGTHVVMSNFQVNGNGEQPTANKNFQQPSFTTKAKATASLRDMSKR
jgi:hypothetical protein